MHDAVVSVVVNAVRIVIITLMMVFQSSLFIISKVFKVKVIVKVVIKVS